MVKDLDDLLREHGPIGAIAFAERHSIPEPNTGCWLFLGTLQAHGYGFIVDPRKPFNRASPPRVMVHRIVCEAKYLDMDRSLLTRHKCDNPSCVNPDHLEPGTHQDNCDDKIRRGRDKPLRGEQNGRAKLTKDDVEHIRNTFRRNTPGESEAFSKRYGVAQSIIRRVVAGSLWASCFLFAAMNVALAVTPPSPDSEDGQLLLPHSEYIVNQHAPNGQWCCDLGDARIAELRRRQDGHYEVFYSKERYNDGTDEWLLVPESAILPQQSPIYVPIAWILRGRVYCVALSGAS